jgi:hypothetical protein
MRTAQAFFPIALVLAACGSSQPADEPKPDIMKAPPSEPKPKPKPTAEPTSEPADTGSFAALPSADVSGGSIRLSYEGGNYTLSDSAIVPAGKSYALRFEEPETEGAHVIKITPAELKAGEPSKVEGKSALFFQLTDGKNTDGAWKLVDISKSCTATGTVTVAEIPKPGSKVKGSMDVTITCEGVNQIKGPIALKGDFSNVPLLKK